MVELSYFLEHLETQGLTQKEAETAEKLIAELYKTTGRFWRPRNCSAVDLYVEEANKTRQKVDGKLFGEIRVMRFLRDHFFWISPMSRERIFIIDPTGVPINLTDQSREIIPYFGLHNKAEGTHKLVYQHMVELDEWGTRDLPPGFHP